MQAAAAILQTIRSIPRGKVATYGQVAEAAGFPNGHRQVAQALRSHGGAVPWHRVLGAGGQIKVGPDAALDQRLRLEMEGVRFRGKRVDMAAHQHSFTEPRAAKRPKSSPQSKQSSARSR